MRLSLTRGGRLRLDREGKLPVDFKTTEGKKILAACPGVTEEVVSAAILALENGTQSAVTLESVEADKQPPTLHVRRIDSPASTGREVGSFGEALSVGSPGDVIEWGGKGQLCCLDVDYHDRPLEQRPTEFHLLNLTARVQPAPSHWWVTQGRGLHAMYSAAGHLSAEQYAAVAGLAWLNLDPSASFDLTRSTRYPPGEWFGGTQTSDLAALSRWFGREVDSDAIDDWLSEKGLTRGQSYAHDRCPAAGGAGSHGAPVFVGETGIVCQKCESAGVVLGGRRAGYFPYVALVGGVQSDVARLVLRFTHWEHASLVVADRLSLSGEKARVCYSAAVGMVHGPDDPRVPRVLTAGVDMVRLDNRWTTRDALSTWDKNIQPMLAALPACQDKDGKPIPERVTRFTQGVDLSEFGYPAVTPIRGLRIYSHHLAFPDEQRISVVVPNEELRSPERVKFRPCYVKGESLESARREIGAVLPLLNWDYLFLLIAARGCAEGQTGLAPLILTAGPSGSGKSNTVHIAAAIVGDTATEVGWQRDSTRFRQSVAHGADAGTFVAVNELFKDAARARLSPREAMDVFLNLTPASVSHKLYVGPVPLGRVPVTVVTDVGVPQSLRNDIQLARRFVYVPLRDRVDWETSMRAVGLHRFEGLRLHSPALTDAANVVVSHVIDRWFTRPMTLTEIAESLGFTTLEKSPDFDDPTDALKRLFHAVCDAPDLTEPHLRRWPARGWKLVSKDRDDPLSEAWREVADSEGARWYTSRRCDEMDWKKVLSVASPARCETKRHGAVMAIRFRGESDSRVNKELME